MNSVLTIASDYGAVVVGLALLLTAAAVLPKEVRWYVLTAGLVVFGYEAYMRFANRKLLAEADAERERLRGELKQLDAQRSELEQDVSQLHQQLAELNARSSALNSEREALAADGAALAGCREQLDSELEQLAKENSQLLQRSSDSESLLAQLRGAEHAVERLGLVSK